MPSNLRLCDARARYAGVFFLFVIASAAPGSAQFPPPTSRPSAPSPAKGPGEFQPGVSIDWASRTVRVRGRVAQTSGPLEFFACFAGKDHESAVRMDAEAEHVFMALGLCGHTPGAPAIWNESEARYSIPTGDLISVFVTWTGNNATPRRAAAFDWLVDVATEQQPLIRPWVFTGSIRTESGGLAAGQSGAGVAIVDMPDSLLALTRSYASSDNDLWAVANSEVIPPPDTPVVVEFRPAEPHALRISMDFRGTIRVDGQIATMADAVDLISLALRSDQNAISSVEVYEALHADRARLTAALITAGVPSNRVRFDVSPRTSRPSGE